MRKIGVFRDVRTNFLQKFCLAFSKASGGWGNAPYNGVFFLIAFNLSSSPRRADGDFAAAEHRRFASKLPKSPVRIFRQKKKRIDRQGLADRIFTEINKLAKEKFGIAEYLELN